MDDRLLSYQSEATYQSIISYWNTFGKSEIVIHGFKLIILASCWKLKAILINFSCIPFLKSSLTCENNALKWHLHYVNTHTHFIPHTYSWNHAQCWNSSQALSILKGTPSLYFERMFQKHLHLMKHGEKQAFILAILSHSGLLKFWLWTVSFSLTAFVLLRILSLTWHRPEKHDQITKYFNPSPLPSLPGDTEGIKVGSPREIHPKSI